MSRKADASTSGGRLLATSDSAQVRIAYREDLGGVDVRLHRKTLSEDFAPTYAGLVIPRSQLRAFVDILTDILREVEA